MRHAQNALANMNQHGGEGSVVSIASSRCCLLPFVCCYHFFVAVLRQLRPTG